MAAPTVFSQNGTTWTIYTHQKNIVGHGAYGVVYQGFDDRNRTIAAKCLTEVQDPEVLTAQAQTLRTLEHRNLVKIYSVERLRDSLWIVMEHYADGNLNKFFMTSQPTFQQKIDVMCDVMRGVEYLHQQNLVHRNIKPQNILMSSATRAVKLTDYEVSAALDPAVESAVMTANVDTLAFKAPEYFLRGGGGGGGAGADRGVDTYCSALVLLSMLQHTPGSPVLVPRLETLPRHSPLHVLSIGQLHADRVENKGLSLNIVLDRENEAVLASVVSSFVAIVAVVSGSVASSADTSPDTAVILSAAVAMVSAALSGRVMFGTRAAGKLVGLLLAWSVVAVIVCTSGVTSGVVKHAPGLFGVLGSVLSGLTVSWVGYLLGVPLREMLTVTPPGGSTVPGIVAGTTGGLLGAFLTVYAADPLKALSAAVGALFGALGAAAPSLAGSLGLVAVRSNPLSVLAGAAAVGSALSLSSLPLSPIPSLLSGLLLSGSSWLIGSKLPALLGNRRSQSSVLSALAYIGVPSIALGVASSLGADGVTALGVMGAAAGVTAGLTASGHALPAAFSSAGDAFIGSDDPHTGSDVRKKRSELRALIRMMTSYKPRDRLAASDVIQRLQTH